MPFTQHRLQSIAHFIWLEERDPIYAMEALTRYRTDPNCPCPNILADVKAEKARMRLMITAVAGQVSTSASEPRT
jgi:hypothetical protein